MYQGSDLIKIRSAADILGCHPLTIKNRIKDGYLQAHRLPGASFNSPVYVRQSDLADLIRGRRDQEVISIAAERNPAPPRNAWDRLNSELQRRATAAVKSMGGNPQLVLDLLSTFGVAKISDLTPDQQASFRARLIRLVRFGKH